MRRCEVSAGTLRLLRVALRYSASRDAYVLRGIGRQVGPVVKLKEPTREKTPPQFQT